jgi:hypothetical protein
MKIQKNGLRLLDDPTNTRRLSVAGLDGDKHATEASKEAPCQASEGRNASLDKPSYNKHKKSTRAQHRVGTWNVNGILKPGKLSITEKQMENTHLRAERNASSRAGTLRHCNR